MKKILLSLLILTLSISLIGCSKEKTSETNQNIEANKTTEETKIVDEREVVEETGPETQKTDIGLMTIYKTNEEVNLEQQSGPFIVKVLKSRISTLEPNEDSKFMFDNKDKVTIITLYVEVENTSKEINYIYPNQGTIVTNTKEQVDCDLLLSEDIGGDFIGEVIKKGNIFFVLDSDPEEITNAKYIISGPHNENLDRLGEDITFELSFQDTH